MLSADVLSVGLRGAGLAGWPAGAEVLRNSMPLGEDMGDLPAPSGISPRERRRLSPIVALALAVAEEAVSSSPLEAANVSSVFCWPHGDTGIVNTILAELCTEERYVSPTAFHNSVHNVAVGYWSIATGCRMPCTSIAAGMDTFVVGLVKALMQVRVEGCPVLLTVTDAPFPEPIHRACPVDGQFAAALTLAPEQKHSDDRMARIEIGFEDAPAGQHTLPRHDGLKQFWDTNAVSRSLPIFEYLAEMKEGSVLLPFGSSGALNVTIANYGTVPARTR